MALSCIVLYKNVLCIETREGAAEGLDNIPTGEVQDFTKSF